MGNALITLQGFDFALEDCDPMLKEVALALGRGSMRAPAAEEVGGVSSPLSPIGVPRDASYMYGTGDSPQNPVSVYCRG